MIAADDVTVDTLHRMLAHGTMVDIAWGRQDAALAAQHGARARDITEKSGIPYLMVYGRAFQALALALQGEHSAATTLLVDALGFARERHAGLENEARILCDLAWVQQRAGLADRARVTAEAAAAVARRRGARIWQAYAEWLLHGPSTPRFRQLVEETGARLLTDLPAPRH